MAEIFSFQEHDVTLSGEKHHLLDFARRVQDSDWDNIWTDLAFKILSELEENSDAESARPSDFPSEQELERLREKYPPGTKVRLISMIDPWPVLQGTIGEVQFIDDAGGIHCRWQNGSGLALYEAVDTFEIL